MAHAYGTEEQLFAKCKQSFDECNASYILVQLANQCLGLHLDLLVAFVGAFVGGIAPYHLEYNFYCRICTKFSDVTVLTIAHRINTIMDINHVLVLDDRNIADFDSPDALISLENGIFKSLVKQSEVVHSGKMDDC
eukprot:15361001-Ditylum_brightwellii.AAC.2